MRNAMTHALKLEERDFSPLELDLGYSKDAFKEISEKCREVFNLTCRQVKRNDSLTEGEWLIVFFGYWPIKYDYEGTPEVWDYTFARQEEEGTWTERASTDSKVTTVNIDGLITEFKKENIKPLFIAVKE